MGSRAAAFTLACLAAGQVHAQVDVAIRLRDAVAVPHADLRLGQIADIETGDLAAIRLLVAWPVRRLAGAGAQTVVRQGELAARLRSHPAARELRIAWGPRELTHVRMAGAEVPAHRLEAVAAEALRAQLQQRGGGWQAWSLQAARDLLVPEGRLSLQPRLPAWALRPGRTLVWVDVAVDGRLARSVPVTFMLEPATGAVHGTAEGMGSDGAFGPIAGSGRPASMASTTLPASATARMPAAALARPAGPLLVQRGAWVDLVLGEGGIRLQARAQALAAGTLDAVIPVQATHGGTVSARVVGAGRVEALP